MYYFRLCTRCRPCSILTKNEKYLSAGRRVPNHFPPFAVGPIGIGGFRELNPGPLAPEASIMPLYQIPVTLAVCGVSDILYRDTGHQLFFCFSLFPTAPRLRYHTVTLWLHVLDQKKAAKSKITSELYQEWLVNHCVFHCGMCTPNVGLEPTTTRLRVLRSAD